MIILKILKIILAALIILSLAIFILSRGNNYSEKEISYGATFSQKHAAYLVEGKWRNAYLAILDELNVKKIRLIAYWDLIQPDSSEEYNYADLDWQIEEAEKRGAKIILAIGYRLPRWPECHLPNWAPRNSIDCYPKISKYIKKTIGRYKDHQAIIAWQIENEPFLTAFGECPNFGSDFLDMEIAMVKELDDRPVIVTDSGELSFWVPAAQRADIFGTSMYLNTYSKALRSYIHYPIGPWFFHLKKNLTKLFAHPKEWIVIEMQAEPWGPTSYTKMSEEDKSRTMDLKKFRQIIEFGKKSGFKEFYLWGVEWWYWEKEIKNNPVFWEEAKTLYNK